MKFRKKAIVIEAIRYTETNEDEILKFASNGNPKVLNNIGIRISTLEGVYIAQVGNWIIKGVKGEFYPCRNDIFEMTYEPVKDTTTTSIYNCPKCGAEEATQINDPCRNGTGTRGTQYYCKTITWPNSNIEVGHKCLKTQIEHLNEEINSMINDLKLALVTECTCGGGDGIIPPCTACRIAHGTIHRWPPAKQNTIKQKLNKLEKENKELKEGVAFLQEFFMDGIISWSILTKDYMENAEQYLRKLLKIKEDHTKPF